MKRFDYAYLCAKFPFLNPRNRTNYGGSILKFCHALAALPFHTFQLRMVAKLSKEVVGGRLVLSYVS